MKMPVTPLNAAQVSAIERWLDFDRSGIVIGGYSLGMAYKDTRTGRPNWRERHFLLEDRQAAKAVPQLVGWDARQIETYLALRGE